jgi:hypothetical protein
MQHLKNNIEKKNEFLLLNDIFLSTIKEVSHKVIKHKCKFCNKTFTFHHNKTEHELVWHIL